MTSSVGRCRRASLRVAGPTVLAAALVAASPAAGQDLSDRIMAVVGGNLLLQSQWGEQTAVLAEQFGVSSGTPEFRRLAEDTFDQMIRDLVIVAAAERDTTLRVTEDQVLREVDSDIAQIRQRFGSEEEFQRQLRESQWGSLAAYRADLQDRKRHELLGQVFLETRRGALAPGPVDEAEIRAYWEENQEAFGPLPMRFRFEEIPVTLTPTEESRAAAREKAERALAELTAGRDFGAVARQFSDDSVSARQDGDLGWFGRGRMVPAFEEAAFSATPGEIVGPVESPYGWHLIQVLDRRGEEVRARHVLVGFQLGSGDRERAGREAEEIRDRIAAGADVDSLQAARMPGDTESAEPVEIDATQLPPAYATALDGLEPGGARVVETSTGFSVVVLLGTSGGEPPTYEIMAPRIRLQLARQKAEDAFVGRLQEEIYVDVRLRPEEVL